MSFSFNELDSLLSDQQYAIAKRGNFDLPFGGTTEAEFDFLAKNGAINTMAPNFLSFMAGISASNLATQANRQQQFEQFGKLREANSVIANRDSATRNNLLEGDSRELQMPYVGNLAKANAGLAEENWQHQQLVNANYQRDFDSQMNAREAQTEGAKLQNAQQHFINKNLQGREDLYTRSQNAAIDQTKMQTAGAEITNRINSFKESKKQEIHDLEMRLQKNQISREEYDIKKLEFLSQYFAADRQIDNAYKQSQTDANNALAQERRNGNGGGWWYPTMETNNPTPTQQPQIPPQSGLGTNASQTQDIVKSALIKQAQGVSLSPSEIALLQGMNLLVGGY
ncbi:MAG: hypothetical protein E6Q83_03430 [Thiothrix sp.]|nr:MAG: hypothetical protein E6Q83_03430 [Thiothrix sp.]